MNELTPTQPKSALVNAEGQRATQEIQAQLVIAQQFPRDEKAAIDRIINTCTRAGLAEQSTYAYSRGGSSIEGPSPKGVRDAARLERIREMRANGMTLKAIAEQFSVTHQNISLLLINHGS